MPRFLAFLSLCLLLVAGPAPAADDLDDLKDKLRHFDLKLRMSAIDGLEQLGGDKAAAAVAGALDDDDWGVQIHALKALGKLKSDDTVEAVARAAVQGEIILVREAAAQALYDMVLPNIFRRILKVVAKTREEPPKIRALETAGILAGKGDVDVIAPFLRNRDTKIRAAAFAALGKTKSPDAIPYALKGLRDKTVTVRVVSGVALGELGGKEAMKGMADLVLGDVDPYVMERMARGFRGLDAGTVAEYLVRRIGQEKNLERRVRLVELLSECETAASGEALIPLLSDPVPAVRAWAARGIGRSGHVPGALKLEPLVLADEDATVRRMALEGLLMLVEDKPVRLAKLAEYAVKGSDEIKIRSCVFLKKEKDASIVKHLYPLVDAAGWRVPTAAIITIGALGHEDEVEVLAKRLSDRDWRIRAACLEALGQARHITVFPHLIKGLNDPDDIAKSAALKNLQVLSQKSMGPDKKAWAKWYEENKDSYELTKRGFTETIPDDFYGKSKYLIEILQKAQIVCVLGKWDHAEIVLEHLGIKSTIITPQKIYDIGLNPKQLMLINCEGSLGKKHNVARIQWFVHVGGYLMATDWALQNAVVRAFPGYVDRHSKSKTGNDVVIIEAADPEHPLLRGVFNRTTKLMWWLEVIAYPMTVADPFRTEILVDSLEMLQKYASSPMATVFDFGHGKVETCVSHFFLQEEGLTNRTTSRDREIFAADNLGISLEQIRKLKARGFFDGQITEAMTKEIAEDYSMFRLIVNFVVEKRRQVEGR